jgi:hypothetical protein
VSTTGFQIPKTMLEITSRKNLKDQEQPFSKEPFLTPLVEEQEVLNDEENGLPKPNLAPSRI